jgi:hypothetical protein
LAWKIAEGNELRHCVRRRIDFTPGGFDVFPGRLKEHGPASTEWIKNEIRGDSIDIKQVLNELWRKLAAPIEQVCACLIEYIEFRLIEYLSSNHCHILSSFFCA